MVSLLIVLLIILSGSIFLSIVFDKKIEETLIVWMLGIVFLLYLFGLVGILKYGVYFIEIMSIVMLSYVIYRFIRCKTKANTFKSYLTPGFIMFLVFFAILSIMHHGRLLTIWDEFTHWGDSVKVMYTINDFITSSLSDSIFKQYPPAMSLFQYFFIVINRSFNEGLLFISYQLIGISLLLPFTKNLKWKNGKNVIFTFLIIFIIPTIFYVNYYSTIYIDAMIGITFASLIGIIIQNKKIAKFEILNLSLYTFFLSLLKDAGLFFSLFSVIVLMLKILIPIVKSKKCGLKNKLISFWPVFVLIGVITISKLTWNYEIVSNKVPLMFTSDNGFVDIIKLLLGMDNTYRATVYYNFRQALLNIPLITNFLILDFSKIFILIVFLFGYFCKKDKENTFIFISVIFGLIIYIIGLIITYCFKFVEYEALILASYERYIGIYLCGLLVFIGIYVIIKNKDKWFTILVLSLLLLSPMNNLLNLVNSKSSSIEKMSDYQTETNYIKSIIDDDEKVWIIIQNTKGYEYWAFRYYMRPFKINFNFSWSIGEPYDEEDVWTQKKDSATWMDELLNNYDYVYIYLCDDQFINEFGDLFYKKDVIDSQQLYKINKKEKKLELIERNVMK